MIALHFAIRALHVLLGAFWAGAVFLLALFLVPALEEAGPAGGTVMQALMRRNMTRVLVWTGVLTVLTGLLLLWRLSNHFTSSFMGSVAGILLSTGGTLGIITLIVGVHVSKPAADKLGALGAKVAASGAPPTADDLAEMARLRGRLNMAARLQALMLMVAVICMALGPHV
jgi:uncharacterized membrane protein